MTTHRLIPTAVVCVPASQRADYAKIAGAGRVLTHPDKVRGLTPKLNWIFDHVHDREAIVFVDDDITSVQRCDQASSSAMAELLSHLDYLRRGHALIATTNEFGKLRALCKGRLESRFVRFHVAPPSVEITMAFLCHNYRITKAQARAIALGAVPEGCLPSVGCNMRTAINDAQGLTAAKKARAA